MIQLLVFNTTTKSIKLYENASNKYILFEFDNVPTVKVVEGYYEVMISEMNGENESRRPIARFPIANTNMIIEK